MRDYPLLERALVLANDILAVQAEVEDRHFVSHWHKVVYVYLSWSKEALWNLQFTLGRRMWHTADILLRHLFELSVRLEYLRIYPKELDAFLKHSGIIDVDNRHQRIRVLQEQGNFEGAGDLLYPTWGYGSFAKMCEKVHLSGDRKEIYVQTSEKTHGGVVELPLEIGKLAGRDITPDWEPARKMVHAIHSYIMVANVNIREFPHLKSDFASFGEGTDWDNGLAVLQEDILNETRRQYNDLFAPQEAPSDSGSPAPK